VKKVHLAVAISILISVVPSVFADDLVSLDDPPSAPSAANAGGLESLDSLDGTAAAPDQAAPDAGGGDTEVTLDLGNEDAFNPYTFSRNSSWAFLPIGALILVGLHMLRVPKRKSKRKIDQARRFFRGISGEGTKSSIVVPPPRKSEKA
jgi:hypothetical protein